MGSASKVGDEFFLNKSKYLKGNCHNTFACTMICWFTKLAMIYWWRFLCFPKGLAGFEHFPEHRAHYLNGKKKFSFRFRTPQFAIAIYRAYQGWLLHKVFSKFDTALRHNTVTVLHIQFTLGVWLYFISPIADYFLHNFKEAIHMREIRFFGMEHGLMMLIAVTLIQLKNPPPKAVVMY